jgi:hypothetical protein
MYLLIILAVIPGYFLSGLFTTRAYWSLRGRKIYKERLPKYQKWDKMYNGDFDGYTGKYPEDVKAFAGLLGFIWPVAATVFLAGLITVGIGYLIYFPGILIGKTFKHPAIYFGRQISRIAWGKE